MKVLDKMEGGACPSIVFFEKRLSDFSGFSRAQNPDLITVCGVDHPVH